MTENIGTEIRNKLIDILTKNINKDNKKEVEAFITKSSFLEQQLPNGFGTLCATDIRNQKAVPVAVNFKAWDINVFEKISSDGKYVKETRDYSSEILSTRYFHFKSLLNYGIQLFYVNDSGIKWSCDELTQNSPEIENLYYFMPLEGNPPSLKSIVKAALKDPLTKYLIEIIKEMFTSMPEYQFIPSNNYDQVASALATYLCVLACEDANLCEKLFLSDDNGECNVRFRIDGRIRIYYPKYGGTKDWVNVESNENGAYETPYYISSSCQCDPKDLVKKILMVCGCDTKSKQLFKKLLDSLFKEDKIGCNDIFVGVFLHILERIPFVRENISFVNNGRGTFEIRRVKATTGSCDVISMELNNINEYKYYKQLKYNCNSILKRLNEELLKKIHEQLTQLIKN